MMRKFNGKPDASYNPRDATESLICDKLIELTEHEVMKFYTRAECKKFSY